MTAVAHIFDRRWLGVLDLNYRARISVAWALKLKTGKQRASRDWRIGDLRKLTRRELAVVPGCGPKTLKHIEEKLAGMGLALAKEPE